MGEKVRFMFILAQLRSFCALYNLGSLDNPPEFLSDYELSVSNRDIWRNLNYSSSSYQMLTILLQGEE